MDKDKYLGEDRIEELLDEGFDFEDIVGQRMSFQITGMKEQDDQWRVTGKAVTAMTINGVDWEEAQIPVSTLDDDFDSALATVMVSLAGTMNNPRMMAKLRIKLDHTKLGAESKEVL